MRATLNLLFSLFQEDHKYYVSEIIKNGQDYWVDVTGNENHNINPYLSDSYLLRQVSLHQIINNIIFFLELKITLRLFLRELSIIRSTLKF